MSRCKSSLAAFAACVLALSFEASAQTGGLQTDAPDFSRGATLPPTSAALVDDATAPLVNPAGLARMPGLQLFYLHERNLARNQIIEPARGRVVRDSAVAPRMLDEILYRSRGLGRVASAPVQAAGPRTGISCG